MVLMEGFQFVARQCFFRKTNYIEVYFILKNYNTTVQYSTLMPPQHEAARGPSKGWLHSGLLWSLLDSEGTCVLDKQRLPCYSFPRHFFETGFYKLYVYNI